jgi:hypothetical protein
MSDQETAQDALDHSEDPGERAEEPVEIERRPSGSQVVSVRLPTELARRLFEEAARLGVRPSELTREAVEHFLGQHEPVAVFRAAGGAPGWPVRIITPTFDYRAENTNLIVEEPLTVVALGFEEPA